MVDRIFYNGEIHTFDKHDLVYEAVAVEKGKIVFAGSDEEVLKYQTPQTDLQDLHKQTMLPGFIDAHLHIFSLGFNLSYVNCHVDSIAEIVEMITQKAEATNDEHTWIIGQGFDESLFKEGRNLHKADFAGIKNPVYIVRYCLHEAVVNETALEKAHITADTEIENGIIERDGNGETTGLLRENATSLIKDILPPYTNDDMKHAIQLANDHLLKNGITTAHDAGLGFFVDPYREFDVLREMGQENHLKVNMYVMILAEYFKAFYEKNQHLETDKLKLSAMKMFADGTLSGRTAALLEPYKDSTEKGLLLYTDKEMEKNVDIAHQMNKQVAIHAIGDRAVDQVLRIYEKVSNNRPITPFRHRVEHATLTNDALIQKMDALHVVPVPQPTLIYEAGDAHHAGLDGDSRKYFAYKSFMENHLPVAGSSDSPVVDCNPLLGIYAAMSRKTINGNVYGENERLTLKEAVKMYTENAAYAGFEEHDKGSIEKGKHADFVVLPRGFMDYSAEMVKSTKIEKTIINGEVVYEK